VKYGLRKREGKQYDKGHMNVRAYNR